MKTPSLLIVTRISLPSRVVAVCPSDKSVDRTSPSKTWYSNIEANSPVGSDKSMSKVPSGKAANASSVGAKTVKGPVRLRSSANSAATTAAARVSWSSLLTMTSTTVVGGKSTASITCTTPLSVWISAVVTSASLMKTPSLLIVTWISFPSNVVIDTPSDKSVDNAWPSTTWYNRISANCPVVSAINCSKVPSGSAANASSDGAKTEKEPAALKSSANPASITAVSNTEWSGLLTTTSTTVVCANTPTEIERINRKLINFFICVIFVLEIPKDWGINSSTVELLRTQPREILISSELDGYMTNFPTLQQRAILLVRRDFFFYAKNWFSVSKMLKQKMRPGCSLIVTGKEIFWSFAIFGKIGST